MDVCAIRVVKMKEHLLFHRQPRILCIGDRAVIGRVV